MIIMIKPSIAALVRVSDLSFVSCSTRTSLFIHGTLNPTIGRVVRIDYLR